MRPRSRAELENPERLARLANGPGTTPRILREKMRETFGRHLDLLEEFIANPELKIEERLRAFEILAKYGLGTNLNHSAGDDPNAVPGVIALPQLDMTRLQASQEALRAAARLSPTPPQEVFPDAEQDTERTGPELVESDDTEHGGLDSVA